MGDTGTWLVVNSSHKTPPECCRASGDRPRGRELLVAGYFNTDLESLGSNKRDKDISEEMAMEGLYDMDGNSLPCMITWTQDV